VRFTDHNPGPTVWDWRGKGVNSGSQPFF